MTTLTPASAAGTVERKPFGVKKGNALLLGLLGLTVASGFCGVKRAHMAAGLLLAGLIARHVCQRRRAL